MRTFIAIVINLSLWRFIAVNIFPTLPNFLSISKNVEVFPNFFRKISEAGDHSDVKWCSSIIPFFSFPFFWVFVKLNERSIQVEKHLFPHNFLPPYHSDAFWMLSNISQAVHALTTFQIIRGLCSRTGTISYPRSHLGTVWDANSVAQTTRGAKFRWNDSMTQVVVWIWTALRP